MPIVTTIEGKIAQIAIDRPEKRNTLNSELCKDLAREFLELNDDTRVRSIVLCGHNNVFCAGLDIEEKTRRFLVNSRKSSTRSTHFLNRSLQP
jgi:enoyl-CoA hydratase/carnithine racemase